jgi:hypothetical protein
VFQHGEIPPVVVAHFREGENPGRREVASVHGTPDAMTPPILSKICTCCEQTPIFSFRPLPTGSGSDALESAGGLAAWAERDTIQGQVGRGAAGVRGDRESGGR